MIDLLNISFKDFLLIKLYLVVATYFRPNFPILIYVIACKRSISDFMSTNEHNIIYE